jgi:hypothetical protein
MRPTLPVVSDGARLVLSALLIPLRCGSRHALRQASRKASLGLGALAWLGQGCLVTNNVDYDRPNTPALLTKLQPTDFTAVTKDCMDGNRSGMKFDVTVYDPDVADRLQVRVLVNGVSEYFNPRLAGTQATRDFTQCIDYDKLNNGCSHVEILVSNQFVEGQPSENPYATEDEYDIGRVEWWLLGPSENYPEVGVSECQNIGGGEP